MNEYKQYRRTAIAEMADWHEDFDMTNVSVSEPDKQAGSPKQGDKIARNPKNHDDKWLVAAAYFADNFEPLGDATMTLPSTQRAALAQANHEFLTTKNPTTKEAKDLCERLEALATDNPDSLLGVLADRIVKCLKETV